MIQRPLSRRNRQARSLCAGSASLKKMEPSNMRGKHLPTLRPTLGEQEFWRGFPVQPKLEVAKVGEENLRSVMRHSGCYFLENACLNAKNQILKSLRTFQYIF